MEIKDLRGKKLLILAGADVHVKVVLSAKKLGVYTIVTDYLPIELSPAKQVADEYWMYDIKDVDSIVDKCRECAVDGVLTFCIDPAQMPYCEICKKLGVPCYGTKEQFEILTNKRLFKEFCLKNGVDVVPEYTIEDIQNGSVTFPVLVKPTDSRGSRGQAVCYTVSDVLHAITMAQKESKDGGYIIEKYMIGKRDMSFSYIVIDGRPYLLKIGDRYLGEKEDNLDRQQIATILPSINHEKYTKGVQENVIGMIESLGVSFGAVFLQGFWDNGKVYMYDPGMRFPGGDFDIVLREATGFDNMTSFIYFALTGDTTSMFGNPKDVYKLNGGICLILSFAVKPGVIAEISGLDVMALNPSVHSVSQRVSVGDVIPSSGDVRQRAAELVAYFNDRASVSEFLSLVYRTVSIKDVNGDDMIISKLNIN